MYFSSRTATMGILAVAFFLVMWGVGPAQLQADHHHSDNKGCGCQAPPSCEAPPPMPQCPCERLKPLPGPCDVPAPQITKPCVPPSEGCCPIDPKEVKKLEKEAAHAQHEAAEACRKQQKAAAHAQHEIDEAAKRGQDDIDKAHAHLEHENGEWAETVAKYNSLGSGSSESVAEATPTTAPECAAPVAPQPEPEAVIITPVPAPSVETPAPTEPAQITEAPQPQPKQLPRTASPLELIGLIGLASSMSGSLIRFFRR